MKSIHLKIVFFTILSLALGACSSSKLTRSASKAYDIGEYHNAIQKYLKAAQGEKAPAIKTEIDYRLVSAYWYIGDYKKAETRIKNLIAKNHPDSSLILKQAHLLRFQEKYDEAIQTYEKFLKINPTSKEALNGIESCKVTPVWKQKPTRFEVAKEAALNSRDADFSPSFIGGLDNSIIFTSMREGAIGRKKSAITGQRNGDLFRSNFDIQKQRWSKPVPLEEDQNINTNLEEGASCLSKDGGILYFTRCRFEKKGNFGTEIFTSLRSKDVWSEAVEVELLPDSLIAAHPSISADGQTLYFVSDMAGSIGGKDIWKVERLSDEWGKPENLGPEINTPGNEMFPFIRENGELYFSSDFHVGMGGLDIFKATYKENKETKKGKWIVENMQSPINSTGDDFSITFLPGKDQGMFASNRTGSMSDDLYTFNLPPKIFRIEGEIYNAETENKIPNAYLRIIGTDGTMLKVRSEDGKFQFKMTPETDYIFAAFKDGFLNAKKIVSTNGLEDSRNFSIKLSLTPTDAPIKVDNINYEFGKAELSAGSTNALDSLIDILTLNPTIVIEIMAHTDYVGSVQYNSDLSQKRAQSVVNYLIQKGVNPKRLVAKGYGETWPKKVTRKLARQYDFLKSGDELNEEFILKLLPEQQEIAKAINRRTEFRVLSNDFRETYNAY
jgi:peptidoglycan-associated lipoprotein